MVQWLVPTFWRPPFPGKSTKTMRVCVCENFLQKSLGGRPKKRRNVPACPSSVTAHVHSIAGPCHRSSSPLLPSRSFASSFILSNVTCPSCHNIVDHPVELPCKALVYLGCCLNLLKKDKHACPSCGQERDTVKESFNEPSLLLRSS